MEPTERFSRRSGQTWALAVLGSLMLHALAAALILRLDLAPHPRPKRVVTVEPLILTEGLAGRPGGGGGEVASVEKKAVISPTPAAKPRNVRPQRKPTPRALTEAPPPELALPTPVKNLPPPPAATSPVTQTSPGASRTVAGLTQGGTGSGRGAGSGSGSGVGPGAGTGAGGVDSGAGTALKDYLQKVRKMLDQNKHYPPLARRQHLEGVVVLQFTIYADGRIENPQLKRSSGHTVLDEEAQETVRRVKSFPPFPPGLGRERLTIEIPLAFRLLSS